MDILQMLDAMSATPDPAAPVITLSLESAKQLEKLLDDGQPQWLEARPAVLELREALGQEQPVLWGTWSPGPNEFHPSMGKEEAEADRVSTLAIMDAFRQKQAKDCEHWPEVVIEVCRSPMEPAEHWQTMAENHHDLIGRLQAHVKTLEAELAALKAGAQ